MKSFRRTPSPQTTDGSTSSPALENHPVDGAPERPGLPRRWREPLAAFVLIWLLLLPLLLADDFLYPDTAERYAPMAESFASGRWSLAFHPRISPVFPVIAGCVSFLFHVSGLWACKLAGALMLSLCAFPLWSILNAVYSRSVALVGLVMLAFSSHLLRLGYAGLRETTAVFFLLLSVAFLFRTMRNGRTWRDFVGLGAALAFLMQSRSDLVVAGLALCIAALLADVVRSRGLIWRSLLAIVILLAVASPFMTYNYYKIGYPVLDVRYAAILRQVEARTHWRLLHNPTPELPLTVRSGGEETAHD